MNNLNFTSIVWFSFAVLYLSNMNILTYCVLDVAIWINYDLKVVIISVAAIKYNKLSWKHPNNSTVFHIRGKMTQTDAHTALRRKPVCSGFAPPDRNIWLLAATCSSVHQLAASFVCPPSGAERVGCRRFLELFISKHFAAKNKMMRAVKAVKPLSVEPERRVERC